MTLPLPALVRDVAYLLARAAVGWIFLAHGWQKLTSFGLPGVAGSFRQMGVPAPQLSAYFATFVELIAGIALIAGLAVPLAALLLVADMLGAFLFVHLGKGVFVTQGGYELVLALGAASLLLAVLGAGRFSVDSVLFGRRRGAATTRAGAPTASRV